MSEFKKENRYLVIKRKDLHSALAIMTPSHKADTNASLNSIDEGISFVRTARGKAPLCCIVIESDWPEYDIAWNLVQSRVEGKPNEIESLRAQLSSLTQELEEAKAEIADLVELKNQYKQIAEQSHDAVVTMPEEVLEKECKRLWCLLDDISTYGDMFKPEINTYFKKVNAVCEKRDGIFTSDGYEIIYNKGNKND